MLTCPPEFHVVGHFTENDLRLMALAKTIANRNVIADIEEHCPRVNLGDGGTWRDTRPMVDPREHAPEVIDMATQALDYATGTGLLARHPEKPYLVRQLVRVQS